MSQEQGNAILEALDRSQAMIEFDLNGIVLSANHNFISALGYNSLDEIKGKHHRTFCDDKYVASKDYLDFWDKLRSGKFDAGQYARKRKDNKMIWIQASYNPVMDQNGKPIKVVKFATDITLEKHAADALGAAMDKSQAVIEFSRDGFVTHANHNFVTVLGYSTEEEILGKHHRIFCDDKYTASKEYLEFWDRLRAGKFDAAQYPRKRKDGKTVWIQASYNPVLDINGNVNRVVKYATEITAQKEEAIALVKTLTETANQVSAAAEELTATATQLTENAKKTNLQANTAATGTEELSVGMKAVTGSTTEMTQSIQEITKSTNSSASLSNESQKRAKHSSELMKRLGKSSQEIGSFVKVISGIAQQTNLLALNATIEAARAGDAGKGFAVVANEVKELAKQTSKSTEEISNKIATIQNDTDAAVKAIEEITGSIDSLSLASSSISAAVEEQSATTSELARIVSESNLAIQEISNTVRDVSAGATESSAAASQTLDAARGLAQLAEGLSSLVKKINL
jgi:methyl-accepting chemotaxis protein